MSSSNLVRWSGMATIVGAILIAILELMEFILFGSLTESQVAATGGWVFVQVIYLIAMLAVLLGLIGLYTRQVEQSGNFGVISFLVAFIGTVLFAGAQWSTAFIGPMLAAEAPDIMDAEPTGSILVGYLLSIILFSLGWLLFGWASLRSSVFPRGAALLVAVGGVLFFIMGSLEWPASTLALDAGLVWMGYTLWSAK